MKTWDQKTKDHWVGTMQMHQDADHLRQGHWWDSKAERGCFFGCAMQYDLEKYDYISILDRAVKVMHLPSWLVRLAEGLFEDLPIEEAKLFPVELCEAIPCDKDIDHIRADLLLDGYIATARANELIKRLEELN